MSQFTTISTTDRSSGWTDYYTVIHKKRGSTSVIITLEKKLVSVWPSCIVDADIIFLPCGFYLLLLFFLA